MIHTCYVPFGASQNFQNFNISGYGALNFNPKFSKNLVIGNFYHHHHHRFPKHCSELDI